MTLDELRKITRKTVQSAGPRYTPGLDHNAPNLHIHGLESAIAGLAVSAQFGKLLNKQSDALVKAIEKGNGVPTVSKDIAGQVTSVVSSLRQLAKQSPRRGKSLTVRLQAAVVELISMIRTESERVLGAIQEKSIELSRARAQGVGPKVALSHQDDSELSRLRRLSEDLHRLVNECGRCQELLESDVLQLRFSNRALLLGPWGSGKTHFLCDVSLALLKAKIPSVVLLAKDISVNGNIDENLAKAFGQVALDDVLRALNDMGHSANVRSLLILDGVNEGDFDSWRKFIYKLTSKVKRYRFVGLVISCRTPMETMLLSDGTRRQYVHLHHPGFGELEFDAQREFFLFYGIPLPEVPLLSEEFSRPLALKILCESFAELPRKEQRKGFIGLTSGQKGMTFVLESFVKRRTEKLEADLGLPHLFCWKLIKGDDAILDHCLSGLASYMAEKKSEAVPFAEAVRIARARPEIATAKQAQMLLTRLIQEGVIHDYVQWRGQEDGNERVIALPYQRFSDHIIARHLLARHLDKSDESTIRASLLPGTPIGRVFEPDDWDDGYSVPALAEALIIEFPEAVKKKIDEGRRELFSFLPKEAQELRSYYRPFIDGFSWRSPATIDASTEHLVATLVNPKFPDTYRAMMDALVMVATKPAHPLSAQRLFTYLARLSMPERDLSWSEALRHTEPGSSIDRVIHFYSERRLSSLTSETASLAVMLLASFLTTTDRMLRDNATLGLVHVGELQPASLFKFAEKALAFNDPYVAERVLAAMYGVTMSLWSVGDAEFKEALSELTSFLVKEMFAPEGRFKTCHVLTREYALGIIELSNVTLPEAYPAALEQYLKAPFTEIPSPFPESRRISSSTIKKVSSAIHMDFANYTLGRLVKGRENYDDKHPEYKVVRRQIEWRMANLGYNSKEFDAADSDISRSHYHGRSETAKINRYGKKYSWIAFFEMYGVRQAQGQLDRNERPSDMDIDPSFPIVESASMPPVAAFFSKKRHPKQHMRWLKSGPNPDYSGLLSLREIDGVPGPWKLICGYVNETDKVKSHRLWAHIHAFLVSDSDVEEFRREFSKEGFPSHEIADVSQDHHTFVGEIGWSKRFGSRNEEGESYTIMAYTRHEQQLVTEPIKAGWSRLEAAPVLKFMNSSTALSKKRNRTLLMRHLDEVNKDLAECDQLTIHEVTDGNEYPSASEFYAGNMWRSRWVSVGGVEVEPLAWLYSAESYDSNLNKDRFPVPAPWLTAAAGLRFQRRSIGMFDPSDARATFYMQAGDEYSEGMELLYIKADILQSYAEKKGKRLVCLTWGEREIHHSISQAFWDEEGRPKRLKMDDTIFKYFDVGWDGSQR